MEKLFGRRLGARLLFFAFSGGVDQIEFTILSGEEAGTWF